MILYHGTIMQIFTPSLEKGKPHNDYGRGFYCTEDIDMAREWACKSERPPAYVHSYELDTEGLSVLDLSQAPFTVLNWIAVLLANRTFQIDLEVALTVRNYLLNNFMPPIDRADLVIGYRADDSYFSYAENFVDNGLSVRRLNDALRLGKLGMQVALVSEKAFRNLTPLGTEVVEWKDYHPRYMRRDTSAREAWREEIRNSAIVPEDLFALDIVRRNIRHGDACLSGLLPA